MKSRQLKSPLQIRLNKAIHKCQLFLMRRPEKSNQGIKIQRDLKLPTLVEMSTEKSRKVKPLHHHDMVQRLAKPLVPKRFGMCSHS